MHLSYEKGNCSYHKSGLWKKKKKPPSDLKNAYMSGVYGRHPSVHFWSTDLTIDCMKYFVVGDIFGRYFSWMTSYSFLKSSCAKQEKWGKSGVGECVIQLDFWLHCFLWMKEPVLFPRLKTPKRFHFPALVIIAIDYCVFLNLFCTALV